ncbi:uncharacterized protein LOC130590093 [Beta vulgaris subsp. vulgaris]|uniref:uncharacterized protein LOC130590093 n=1 Tax=Beta vulgaris subsp. vulgaris TaxID=3555 RepID=UPI0025485C7A|nr:uncharacterized protein LOC130590093 [Beta vulgaris subsp. vulgaris]
MQSGKLHSMKSHDCHVFMERLLPIALKELLPVHVWKAVTEISLFFRDLCCSTITVKDMERLEKNIAEILCKLEKIFPPSFFNSMEHLPVHLPREARLCGPVQYHWIYPFERFLNHLKPKLVIRLVWRVPFVMRTCVKRLQTSVPTIFSKEWILRHEI